ncbi:hypothetical protein [Aeromonas hydrophila]|nr:MULTISPECIES: hypothetical protein [Aeromonas]
MNAANLVTAFSNKTQRIHFPPMSGAEFGALLAEIKQLVNKEKLQ